MPDDFKDPNLQTGPYPAWPTLPPMAGPKPHYLENDPTAWEGGDFPSHVSPLSILMALLGARRTGAKAVPAGEARNPSGIALSRNMENPAENPNYFHYNIFNDLQPIGEVGGRVQGSTAGVNWIGNRGSGPQMVLGVPEIKQLMSQFQQDFPQVQQLQGQRFNRISNPLRPNAALDPVQVIKILKGQP